MLDAYTIRKVVPRLVLAVIGVNLSIYLCTAAVDITNIVGHGLGDLLRAPFVQSGSYNNLSINGNATNDIVGVVGLGALGAIVAAVLHLGLASDLIIVALGMLLLAAVVVVLIAIAILATLVIRYGALLFLSIISPVAIACLVLPGTEKYFKQWWDIFLKTLIVFPIIAAIFALSDILSAILLSTQSSVNGLNGLIAVFVVVAAMYAPLFMIPFSFKLAGGFLGNVYDFMNQQGVKRAQERLNKWKEDPESWYAGNKRRFNQNRFDAGFSAKQIGGGALAGGNAFLRGGGRAGFRSAYKGNRDRIAAQKVLAAQKETEEREAWAAVRGDNDIAHAVEIGGTREEIMQNLKNLESGRFAGNDPETRRALEEYTSLVQHLQGSMGKGAREYVGGEEYSRGTTSYKVDDMASPLEMMKAARSHDKVSSILSSRSYLGRKKAQKEDAHRLETGGHSSSDGIVKFQRWKAGLITDEEFEDWMLDSAWKKNAPTAWANADHNGVPRQVQRRMEVLEQVDSMPASTAAQREARDAAMEKASADLYALLETTSYMPPENRDDYRDLFRSVVKGEKREMPVLDNKGNEQYEKGSDGKVIREAIRDVDGRATGKTRPKVLTEHRALTVKEVTSLMANNPKQFKDFAASVRLFGASEFDQKHRMEEAFRPPGT